MAEFYLSKDALDALYYNPQTRRIITNQRCLYLDMSKDDLIETKPNFNEETDGANIWQDIRADGSVELIAAQSVCEKIRRGDFSLNDVGASPVFIIHIESHKAKKIRRDFGIICMSDQELDLSILTSSCTKELATKGRRDPDENEFPKTYSWGEILSNTKALCNAIVVCDQYIFHNDVLYNNNQYLNLMNILDSLLPQTKLNSEFQVLFIYNKTKIKGVDLVTFSKNIQRLRENSGYTIIVQMIAGDRNCDLFSYAHNRRIATNYSYIQADYSFAALDDKGIPKADQSVRCQGLYANEEVKEGNDFPEVGHELFLERVYSMVNYAAQHPTSGYQYSKNGKISEKMSMDSVNRLVNQFDGLRDGDNCSYLSVPYKSDWQGLKVKDGVYSRVGYKDCIVVRKGDKARLENVIPAIKRIFANSSSVEGENRDDSVTYYWVACTTASDIKTIKVLDPKHGEIASNYYSFNCFLTIEDAEKVVSDIRDVLKKNKLW